MKLSASNLWLSAITALALLLNPADNKQDSTKQTSVTKTGYSTEEPDLVPMRCEPYPECVAAPK